MTLKHSKLNDYHSCHVQIHNLLSSANIFCDLKEHSYCKAPDWKTHETFDIQVHVCCMKYCMPQRRETWLEYLWESTDCCCCKFSWKALEISLSLFMMLWLLETHCSICTSITPCFVQTGDSLYGFYSLDEMFIPQADGLNQPQFFFSPADVNREEGVLQFLCSSMLQTLPRVIVTGTNKYCFSQFRLNFHLGLLANYIYFEIYFSKYIFCHFLYILKYI